MRTGRNVRRRIAREAADNEAVSSSRHVAVVILALEVGALAQDVDWQQQVRKAVQAQNFTVGLQIVERRLDRVPDDLEAQAWKARLVGWSGRLAEAETLYREVLRKASQDGDVLVGLVDVLTWEGKLEEALDQLQGAPPTADVLLRRARLLARVHREREASSIWRELLRRDPDNGEAKAGLSASAQPIRHEFIVGADTDRFNFTDTATAEGITLTSHWNESWTTSFSSSFYQRFGASGQRLTGRVSRTFARTTWISVGGGAAHDEGVIPKREVALETGRAWRIAAVGLVRGLETSVAYQWFWFQTARVQVPSGTALLYLPREWTFAITGGAARSSFPGRGVEWEPTGSARLTFPAGTSRVMATLSFAVGRENFAKATDIGHFSARTFGGSVRYQFARRQYVRTGVYFQQRSQARTQTTIAVSYGVFF